MKYGVSLAITTKGDPSFLLDIPDFTDYEPKVIAITIEGTSEILQLLSPQAPPLHSRLLSLSKLSSLNIRTIIRLDPVFIHLFQAIYADRWFHKVTELVDAFSAAGAKHIISSTGRLSKNPSPNSKGKSTNSWQRLFNIIYSHSPLAAVRFRKEYEYEKNWAGRGYQLRKSLRYEFHDRVKEIVEARGMTYATCQELAIKDCDSKNIPHCKGMPLPFSRKGPGDKFYPITGCTANCHISCKNLENPPCGKPLLVTHQPLKVGNLR
jgi:DNA repair photolyase